MKIDNNQIEINIKDPSLFAVVALVVDQEDFLEKIQPIRNKYQKLFKGNQLLSLKQFQDFKRKIYKTQKETEFNKLIDDVRRSLWLPVIYRLVIQKAVFCGVIEDGDFKLAYFEQEILGSYDDRGDWLDIEYRIVVSPQTRKEDVEQLFNDHVRGLKSKDKIVNYGYTYVNNPRNIEQGKHAVKNHRKWYWMEKQGHKHREIWQHALDTCPYHTKNPMKRGENTKTCTCVDERTISLGIKNYKKLLRKSNLV